jgi:hypothetical protein
MAWRRWVRAVWPFKVGCGHPEADAAIEAAERSHRQAVEDRRWATAVRVEAQAWERQIRDHNVANRYDDWLRQIVRGQG